MTGFENATGTPANFYDNTWIATMAERQAALVKETQDELLNEHQMAFNRWCERRRRTAEGLATLAQQSLAAKSPPEAMQAWMNWLEGAIGRLSEDAKDQMQLGAVWGRFHTNGPFAAALNWEGHTRDAQHHAPVAARGPGATNSPTQAGLH